MLESGRKKNHIFNTAKSHVFGNHYITQQKSGNIKIAKVLSLKRNTLRNNLHKKDEGEETSNMVGTTPQATLVFAHRKSARKKYAYKSSRKDRSYKMYYM